MDQLSPRLGAASSPTAGSTGASAQRKKGTNARSFVELANLLQSALDRSSTVFHVFYSDPVGLNLAVFELWVKGFREEQVVYYRRNLLGRETSEASERELLLLLYRDAIDQYRLMEVLQEFLEQPLLMQRQLHLQLSPRIQEYMINKYYGFDDSVFRELLGRKLTTKARKDLDEVAESTGILLRSCQRQFDNLRRLFNSLDERNFEGNITKSIVDQFLIPWELAERYTCVLFLLFNRFHIQSTKKKTAFVKLADFEYCAASMLLFWVSETASSTTISVASVKSFHGSQYFNQNSEPSQAEEPSLVKERPYFSSIKGDEFIGEEEDDNNIEYVDHDYENHGEDDETTTTSLLPGLEETNSKTSPEQKKVPLSAERRRASSVTKSMMPKPGNTSMEISPTLIWEWRLLKNHVLGTRNLLENTTKSIMGAALRACSSSVEEQSLKGLKTRNFKTWVKSLLTIGAGLSQAKELRDFFEDVVDDLCEPLQQAQLTPSCVEILLVQATYGFCELSFVQKRGSSEEWETYMRVITAIILRLYQTS